MVQTMNEGKPEKVAEKIVMAAWASFIRRTA